MISLDDFILFPERGKIIAQFIMDMLSISFTYFKEAAGIKKDIGLSNLRNHHIVVASFEEKGS